MTEHEAFEILGLEPGASAEAIERAYHDLTKKLHPDQGGSTFLTAQLEEARSTLDRAGHTQIAAQPASERPVNSSAPADTQGPIARFLGADGPYWRMLVRGNVVVMVTLGIYRFWLTTDMRRFLWANTELAGESFEYSGTARELLLGFLMAIAILVPLNVGFFLAMFEIDPLGGASGVLSFALLTFFGHYAVYRARRYRLTRTVYRGVRFLQGGSAWRYAVCALIWWTAILLTLGLAYPFAQARLEKFKMRHTSFGDLSARFEGSGLDLLSRGILMWLITVGPLTAGLFATFTAIDWDALASSSRGGKDDIMGWLESSGFAGAAVYAALTFVWALLALAILYPIFQAMMLRWWMSGLRFGDVIVTSRLSTAQVFGVYARFLWYAVLFSLVAGAIGLGCFFVYGKVVGQEHSLFNEIVATLAMLAGYVVIMLGYSTIYQATVRLGLWRSVAESIEIANSATLERVSAAGEASSSIGEGLADALNVGGI